MHVMEKMKQMDQCSSFLLTCLDLNLSVGLLNLIKDLDVHPFADCLINTNDDNISLTRRAFH